MRREAELALDPVTAPAEEAPDPPERVEQRRQHRINIKKLASLIAQGLAVLGVQVQRETPAQKPAVKDHPGEGGGERLYHLKEAQLIEIHNDPVEQSDARHAVEQRGADRHPGVNEHHRDRKVIDIDVSLFDQSYSDKPAGDDPQQRHHAVGADRLAEQLKALKHRVLPSFQKTTQPAERLTARCFNKSD